MFTVYYTITIEKATLFRKAKTMQMTRTFDNVDNAIVFAGEHNTQMIVNAFGKIIY